MSPYHDIWVRGEVKERGDRAGDNRWRIISAYLSYYRRPFTLLDLGCSTGYFCFRAASEFDCVAVGIDGEDDGSLFRENGMSNTIFLKQKLGLPELKALSESEQFDVVLALNILHHLDDPVAALELVVEMGEQIIIETPHPDDKGACGQPVLRSIYEALSGCPVIARTPSHTSELTRPMYRISHPPTGITRTFIGLETKGDHVFIESSKVDREAIFPFKNIRRDWIPGINLQTYLKLGGTWPTRTAIAESLRNISIPERRHGDLKPWNFILGQGVHVIDGYDRRANFQDQVTMAETIATVIGEVK